MNISKPFTCPCCGLILPFKELFIFKKDYVTTCASCSSPLEPINNKSFHWGFAFGFIGFIIPAEIIKSIYHSSILAFLCGVVVAALTIFFVAFYIKKNTFFKLKTI